MWRLCAKSYSPGEGNKTNVCFHAPQAGELIVDSTDELPLSWAFIKSGVGARLVRQR